MTFADEISYRVIVFLIDFEQFYSDCSLSPGCLINDAIAAFRNLPTESQLLKWYFHGIIEGPWVQGLRKLKLALLISLYLSIFLTLITQQLLQHFILSLQILTLRHITIIITTFTTEWFVDQA